ncbi:MAG: hypothetical protein AAF267_19835 [Deinococcota bacterium]
MLPNQTTTYTLTATNSYGTRTQEVTVTVEAAQNQVCEGDIDATTQAEVDALDSCSSIEGSLTIGGNDPNAIVSLQSLENLERVDGDLVIGVGRFSAFEAIDGNAVLPSLSGLDNLEFVGGHLTIIGNHALTSLEGLDNLVSIGGDVVIGDVVQVPLLGLGSFEDWPIGNDLLVSLKGLEKLTSIRGSLIVGQNKLLTSLEGLNNVSSIDGSLLIDGNLVLPSLTGLNQLSSVGEAVVIGRFDVFGGASSISLEGLNNLVSIGTTLHIIGPINSLLPLANVETAESIEIVSSALTNLAGLEKITTLSELTVARNENLISLEGLTALASVGKVRLEQNSSLMSLQGLSALASVGELSIFEEQTLVSLAGLENLTSLSSLEITGSPNLTSLQGIEGLASINDLKLFNMSVTSFAPLTNFNVTNSLSVIRSNITSFAGLEGTTLLLGGLIVDNNPALTSLAGLENVRIVGGVAFMIAANPLLESLDDLDALEIIRSYIVIMDNGLTSIAELDNIRGYRDNMLNVNISGNTNLDCSPPPDLPFVVDISNGNAVNCPRP